MKRHEYKTSSAWAADVDRIFSNAQKFNEDGSIVYNQATALQVRVNPNSIKININSLSRHTLISCSPNSRRNTRSRGRKLKRADRRKNHR